MDQNSNNTGRSKTRQDIRCGCNQLLARWTEKGIEFKCKRCKQVVMVAYEDIKENP